MSTEERESTYRDRLAAAMCDRFFIGPPEQRDDALKTWRTFADVAVSVRDEEIERLRGQVERWRAESEAWASGRWRRAEDGDTEGLREDLEDERERARQAEAVIERQRVLINKMRHGEYPSGGSAADSADILEAALDAALSPAGGSEEGCCTECSGSGYSGDEAVPGGVCWDCRGTGHPHEGPCVPAGGSEEREDPK